MTERIVIKFVKLNQEVIIVVVREREMSTETNPVNREITNEIFWINFPLQKTKTVSDSRRSLKCVLSWIALTVIAREHLKWHRALTEIESFAYSWLVKCKRLTFHSILEYCFRETKTQANSFGEVSSFSVLLSNESLYYYYYFL